MTAAVVVTLPIATGGQRLPVVAAAVLAALTVVAVVLKAPPAIRAMVYLDVAFLVFLVGAVGSWPPAVTTVLACVVPLAAARLRP